MKLSASHEVAGDNDQAILDTLQAVIVDRSLQEAWPRLFALYRKSDPNNCAFTLAENQYRFNDSCPILRQDICRAYGLLADTFAASHRLDTARQLRADAERNYGCATAGGS